MAWITIPNNPAWEYNNNPPNPGATSGQYPLWLKQTGGVRTNSNGEKVYTEVRLVGTLAVGSNGTMGELSKTFWDAKSGGGGAVTHTAAGLTVALPASVDGTAVQTSDVSFKTLWETTSSNESIELHCDQGGANVGTFNATIDWGDGNTSTISAYNDPELIHNYASAGEHIVRVTGSFPTLAFNSNSGATVPDNAQKLKKVLQMGEVGWLNLRRGFQGCSNLTDFTCGETTMSSNISLSGLLRDCSSLVNINFTGFDTSSVNTMAAMFRDCSALTTVDVSSFDTSNVTTFSSMFKGATLITDIPGLDDFNIGALVDDTGLNSGFMDSPAKLSTITYNALLINWVLQAPIDVNNVSFGDSEYRSGPPATARSTLETTYGWIIDDGGPE